jgi:type IV pilus assembly protein PilB
MISIPPQRLKKLLLEQNLVTEEQFDDAQNRAQRMGQGVGEILVSEGLLSNDYLYNVIASHFGVERANVRARGVDNDVLHLVDGAFAKERNIIPFSKEPDGTLNVAMQDPSDLPTIEFLEKRLNVRVRPYLATPDDLARGFAAYGKDITEDFKKIIEEGITQSVAASKDAETEEEAASQVPVVELVNNLLSYAASLGASDIHWEVLEDEILIRFRVDGILREIIRIPKGVYAAILARIKLLAALKIDEHYKPQDGRFRFRTGQTVVDVRVSVMPTLYGEKIVLRLLESSQRPLSLAELGMMDDQIEVIKRNIKKTYGMLLVTGPTGSGKTTTLYSILNMLNRSEVNIVTVEDPIEYNIKYINQVQINPRAGITFASGLRSILRQDPNIVMVGEIRDEETADISVHAALTGHLVLSTLHTNDSTTAVPRMMDMGVEGFLVAAVFNAVLAQRLVRKICENCIESYTPSENVRVLLLQQLKETEITDVEVPTTLYRGKGCRVCGNSGYRGRVGIFEIFEVTDAIKEVITSTTFSLEVLIEEAKKQGMVTMFEDGIRKIKLGVTTVEEVLRVIRE